MSTNRPGRNVESSVTATQAAERRNDFPISLALFPLINVVLSFFTSTPSRKNASLVLETLGLVAAFLLPFAVGIPNSVSYDDLQQADERYGWNIALNTWDDTSSSSGNCYWWRHTSHMGMGAQVPPSKQLALYVSISVFFLTSALLSIIITYIYLSLADIWDEEADADIDSSSQQAVIPNSDVSSDNTEATRPNAPRSSQQSARRSKSRPSQAMKNWYEWARFAYAISVALLIAGVGGWFVATFYLYTIKFPDYMVLSTGKLSVFTFSSTFAIVMTWTIPIVMVVAIMSTFMAYANIKVQCLLDVQLAARPATPSAVEVAATAAQAATAATDAAAEGALAAATTAQEATRAAEAAATTTLAAAQKATTAAEAAATRTLAAAQKATIAAEAAADRVLAAAQKATTDAEAAAARTLAAAQEATTAAEAAAARTLAAAQEATTTAVPAPLRPPAQQEPAALQQPAADTAVCVNNVPSSQGAGPSTGTAGASTGQQSTQAVQQGSSQFPPIKKKKTATRV